MEDWDAFEKAIDKVAAELVRLAEGLRQLRIASQRIALGSQANRTPTGISFKTFGELGSDDEITWATDDRSTT